MNRLVVITIIFLSTMHCSKSPDKIAHKSNTRLNISIFGPSSPRGRARTISSERVSNVKVKGVSFFEGIKTYFSQDEMDVVDDFYNISFNGHVNAANVDVDDDDIIVVTDTEDSSPNGVDSIFLSSSSSPPKIQKPLRSILKKSSSPSAIEGMATLSTDSTSTLFLQGSLQNIIDFYKNGQGFPIDNYKVFANILQLRILAAADDLVPFFSQVLEKDFRILFRSVLLINDQYCLQFLLNIFYTNPLSSENWLKYQNILQSESNLSSLQVYMFLIGISFKNDVIFQLINDFKESIDDSADCRHSGSDIENEGFVMIGKNDCNYTTHSELNDLIKRIIKSYYSLTINETRHFVPLSVSALESSTEDSVMALIEADPEEVYRVDSQNRSVIYVAAFNDNIGFLELLHNRGVDLSLGDALIGASVGYRDTVMEFLFETLKLEFSTEALEDAAFACASTGIFKMFKWFILEKKVNLYTYRGMKTFLSEALRNEKITFSQNLVKELKYNINFVGEDSVNPKGNSLQFLLTKPTTFKTFLSLGANKDIYIKNDAVNGSDERPFISFLEYAERNNLKDILKALAALKPSNK